jgi:hypothetical protein
VDRQVGQRPVDRHHRPDRPLGHVGQGRRGQRWTWPPRVSSPRPEMATTTTSTSSF